MLRKLILKWLHNDWVGRLEAKLTALQVQVSEQQQRVQDYSSAINAKLHNMESIDSAPNLRKDIADLEQRLDALCQVCGVEVVVTNGEVFTKEISREASSLCQTAAASYQLISALEQSREAMARATGHLNRSLKN